METVEKNMYIGIDFSLISTGMTIIYDYFCDNKHYYKIPEFYTFINQDNISKKRKDILYDYTINIFPYKSKNDPTSIMGTIEYVTFFTNILNDIIQETNPKNIYFCIEGLAYKAIGNTLTSLAGGIYTLNYILKKYNTNNIDIITPKKLKKFIGKGTLDKINIINTFIDDKFFTSPFQEQLKQNPIYFKPIDDICDSAYIAKYIYNKIKKEATQ